LQFQPSVRTVWPDDAGSKFLWTSDVPIKLHCVTYRDADKSLARPGRKQATATEDFDVHISYL